MISPPLTITCASTEGTKRTLIGCASVPISSVAPASSAGASVAAAGGASGAAPGCKATHALNVNIATSANENSFKLPCFGMLFSLNVLIRTRNFEDGSATHLGQAA